jgi:hypothetical protein
MVVAASVSSMQELTARTYAVLLTSDDLLTVAACLLPALVAQLEQAIGAGAVPREVIPLVGQARSLERRLRAARERGQEVLARWA